ncbi:MAG TPA: hypothetical protein VK192_01250 [Sphingomicrobium sp.]|nr:hypothetical protein [Sphingomicrobium sp.]
MANYQTIVRLRPEVREFIRNRRWVHRGDVISYGANIRCDSFSTDGAGFRHCTFKGETLSVADCLKRDRYGIVLGPSNVYAFGLAGNENTMPSLLAERFGFPFANVGLPEGNSRNLFSLLAAFLARAPKPPSVVLHLSGGDFTSFCYTSIADPVFGSPNLKQIQDVLKERRGRRPDPARQMKPLLAFTSLWIGAIGNLCASRNVPLVLGEDVTFFEKAVPNEIDRQCELGKATSPAQERQFAIHRQYVRDYHARRQAVANMLGVPLPGPSFGNDIGYIDEFHYDRQGTVDLTDHFARAIEPLL